MTNAEDRRAHELERQAAELRDLSAYMTERYPPGIGAALAARRRGQRPWWKRLFRTGAKP